VATAAKIKRRTRAYKGPACPACGTAFSHATAASGRRHCEKCGTEYDLVKFDPPDARVAVKGVAESGPAGGVACANHAKNAAVAECERCGGFICELCKTESEEGVFCTACFERLREGGDLASTATVFKDYGRHASAGIVVGLLSAFMLGGLVLGPVSLYYAGRGIYEKRKREEDDGLVTLWLLVAAAGLTFVGNVGVLLAYAGAFR
jgi:hypothetical protein